MSPLRKVKSNYDTTIKHICRLYVSRQANNLTLTPYIIEVWAWQVANLCRIISTYTNIFGFSNTMTRPR
jgi:hypothetical protein